MRWGVTEEEARSGKVLSVCLNEIENSHPFFIGLLGSRYGYAPEMSEIEKNPELKERYPWVVEDISDGLSITEMEMEYGVLRNAADIDAAFFIKQSDLPDDNPKLTSLKAKIRNQKQYPVAEYSTIEQLCKQAEDELRRILDRHFPETEITPLDRERTAQRAYINSRHANYLKRQSYCDIIDDFVHSDEQNLVFTGDSGVGKSALLANWVKENENNDDFNIIYHFVGNSFSDNNYEGILSHFCDEIIDIYHLEKRENNNEKIEEETQLLINFVAEQEKPLVIIIDGINQIITHQNEKLLIWLPFANNKVKFIFSTLVVDETMRVFEQRGYRVETVLPLSSNDREHFVVGYLSNYGKRLSKNQLRRIVNDTENINTLVLKSLLDELICFGSYEHLDSRIEHYLSAPSITDFFDRVLARMEDDYSANEDLVRHALTLIAVSERGLSEDELLSIIGCRQLDWHLFFCAFYNHFIVKNGLITFSHQYMASAVESRYHTSDKSQVASFRQELISYFNKIQNEDKSVSDRRVSELAHQYYSLADWDSLYGILLDFDAFGYFYNDNQPLLGKYWRTLLNADKKYSMSAYMKLSPKQGKAELASDFYDIAFFIQDYIADYKLSLKYYFKALKIQNKELGEDNPDMAATYNNIGYVYECLGNYPESLDYYGKSLEIRSKVLGEEHPDTAMSYCNLGSVYDSLGDYDNAIEYYNKSLKILGVGNPDLGAIYNNIAMLYFCMGDYDKSIEYYANALNYDEKFYGVEHPNTATTYDNIGCYYDNISDFKKSQEFHFKALKIREKIFGQEHPDTASSYNCIGVFYDSLGNFEKALEYYLKSLKIRETLFGVEHIETATCYNNIASVYDNRCEYKKSLEYYLKAMVIYERKVGKNHVDTALCYNNVGESYFYLGNYDKSLAFYNKALKICKKVYGDIPHRDIAETYDNIGLVFLQLGCFEPALEYCTKALEIMIDVFGIDSCEVAICYNNIGCVYSRMKDFDMAIKYHRKSLKIRKSIYGKKHQYTAISYNNIGVVYDNSCSYDKALEYYNKAYNIYKDIFGKDYPDTIAVLESIKEVREKLNGE